MQTLDNDFTLHRISSCDVDQCTRYVDLKRSRIPEHLCCKYGLVPATPGKVLGTAVGFPQD